MYFNTNLKFLRKRKKLSQDAVSELIGLKHQAIGFYEKGTREPSLENLITLAKYFSVSIDDLLLKDLRPLGTLLSRNLTYLHGRENYRQEEVARMLDVSKANMSKYEAGLIELNPHLLVKVSEIFDVTVDDLLKKDLSEGGT